VFTGEKETRKFCKSSPSSSSVVGSSEKIMNQRSQRREPSPTPYFVLSSSLSSTPDEMPSSSFCPPAYPTYQHYRHRHHPHNHLLSHHLHHLTTDHPRHRGRLNNVLLSTVLLVFLFTSSPSSCQAATGAIVSESIVKTFLCENGGVESFELITGSVYSGSQSDTIASLPGTLKLTDCLLECQRNLSCQSVNYETGLCILFSSSATSSAVPSSSQHVSSQKLHNSPLQSSPASSESDNSALQPSRFPVFTIYAQKICLPKSVAGSCPSERLWTFERVIGYELRKYGRKRISSKSKLECMEACLLEKEFSCRSFNYDYEARECLLSEMDRHTLPPPSGSTSSRSLLPASNGSTDYFESNCIVEPNRLCDFKPTKGKILKTVDSVHPDVKTVEGCKEKCVTAPYRCFSFDFGDPANSVCRTSHLDRSSLTHIEEPYLEIPGSVTYELFACYNVSILCRAREMVAQVKTSKLFNGKIYAKSKPNSCVNDVSNTLDFEISMPFHDVMCDVKQVDAGSFANDIIIQHHDMIVTTQDLGLSVHCNYDLSNRSISNINLEVDGDIEHREGGEPYVHSSVVGAPNVTMSITDRNGNGISSAQVGDALALRFEIVDKSSPYEILVRELVAVDGVDSSEILLIDSQGCPTDASIMGVVSRINGNGQQLEAPFDAFKFPSSDVVQFRALVTPCVPACEPINCNIVNPETGLNKEASSYGRRRRSVSRSRRSPRNSPLFPPGRNSTLATNEEVVVVGAIKITDTFDGKEGKNRPRGGRKDGEEVLLDSDFSDVVMTSNQCTDFFGLVITFIIFLLAQLTLIVAWYYVYRLKIQRKILLAGKMMSSMSSGSSTTSSMGGSSSSTHNIFIPSHHHQQYFLPPSSSSSGALSSMTYHPAYPVTTSTSTSSGPQQPHDSTSLAKQFKFNPSLYKM